MANQQEDITILKAKPGEDCEKDLDIHLKEEEFREQTKNARELFSSIQEELDQREEDLKDGLSFLDMKNDTLLSYMIDVCNIVLRKVRGEAIEGHKSVERCVEYRVILEKIKAVDQKLAYQLNKLITLPDDVQEEDQRIDVRNLDIDLEGIEFEGEHETSARVSGESDENTDDESDEEEDKDKEEGGGDDDEEGSHDLVEEDDSDESIKNVQTQKSQKSIPAKSSGVYKPPKLRSVAYLEKDEMRVKGGRRKNYDDFYQDDEARDIVDESRGNRVDEERVRFEEDNYTRLPDENPKKAKRKLKTKEYRMKGRSNKFKRRKK